MEYPKTLIFFKSQCIKMCKLLTYDDEYYVVNQKGNAVARHKDPSNVMTINLENNRVVCFEFNLIYSYLLNELGIKFSSHYKNLVGEAYGDGHVNLEFRVGKYLVLADSVTSILQGDIMQAKLNQPLRGLKCLNINEQTKIEFRQKLHDVYSILALKEGKGKVEYIETFKEILMQYNLEKTNSISIVDRLYILMDKVNTTKMVGIDALSYVLQLREILFNEKQQNNNFIITIIRNNQPKEKNKIATACAIFTINTDSFFDKNSNIYYCYEPKHGLTSITIKQLKKSFNKKQYEYFDEDEPKIPGL